MKPQDIADLKQLIEFLKEYQVAEFDLDRGDLKIRLKFNQPEASRPRLGDLARLLASAPPRRRGRRAAASPASPAEAPAADPDAGLHIVKSPICRHLLRLAFARRSAVCLARRSREKGAGDLASSKP
jgi:acetyl-CoA carboxylase biotin carboxyl carrier protein